MFVLQSEITIGTFKFSGAHEVRIRRGIHGYSDWASIKVPSMCTVVAGKSSSPISFTTASKFIDGDPVTIKLGYDGDLREEFRGFVKRRNLAMPLEIECEGYVRPLRLTTIQADLSKGMDVKEALKLACYGTGIVVDCQVEFTIYGRNLTNATGTALLDEIKKCSDHTLTIFFIEPDVLWCGLVYTAYLSGTDVFKLPTVKYRLGWNVVKDNDLRERIPDEQVQVIINGKLATGDTVRTESDEKQAKRKVQRLMNGVHSESVLKLFANEKQRHMNYTGYDGYLTTFLQPYALPGYNAYITDGRYKERDGTYLVESTEVTYGQHGARRLIGIGPKLS